MAHTRAGPPHTSFDFYIKCCEETSRGAALPRPSEPRARRICPLAGRPACPQAFFRLAPNHSLNRRARPRRRPVGTNALSRRPARSFEAFASDQPGPRSRASRRLGLPQGHRGGGDRRLHPSGLVCRAQGQARRGRTRPVPPARRGGGRGIAYAAGALSRSGPLHAGGGDLHDLQEGRSDPQDPSPDLRPEFRHRRSPVGPARPHRQYRIRRPPDPRSRFARSPGDHARVRATGLSRSGTRLDPLVRRARVAIRLRLDRRLLRRPHRSKSLQWKPVSPPIRR